MLYYSSPLERIRKCCPVLNKMEIPTVCVSLPESLGRLLKCQIWHNNSGPHPSWYLSRVVVQDVNTGQFYYFVCERWFAAEEGDGKVEREIMACEGGLGFTRVRDGGFLGHHNVLSLNKGVIM